MPNYIKTIVKTDKDTLNDIMNKYSYEDKLSFNKIIPMPKDVDIENSSSGEFGLIYMYIDENNLEKKELIKETYKALVGMDIEKSWKYKELVSSKESLKKDTYVEKKSNSLDVTLEKYEDSYDHCINLAKKYIKNYKKYGYVTWYDWSVNNWGTKWDAKYFERNEDTMIFLTAWSFAQNVLLELSKRYPNALFECKFADEDIISDNAAKLTIQNGNVIKLRQNLREKEKEKIWDFELDSEYQK